MSEEEVIPPAEAEAKSEANAEVYNGAEANGEAEEQKIKYLKIDARKKEWCF